MPQPTIPVPDIMFELDKFLLELEQHDKEIQAGVASVGEAAAYSLVWEFGNARQAKKGPKTVKGVNPETGETVWLSIQAPHGYVRISENLYWEALRQEMSKITFSGNTAKEITKELEACAVRAMKTIRKIIAQHAPKDKGDLSKSFEVVMPGDTLLYEDENYILEIG
jgi:hypothetical protein